LLIYFSKSSGISSSSSLETPLPLGGCPLELPLLPPSDAPLGGCPLGKNYLFYLIDLFSFLLNYYNF